MAFMTLHPTRPGEFTIIPKVHIDHFSDLPDDLACHIMRHAQRLSQNLLKHFKPERVGIVVHGYGIHHAHMIIVPQHNGHDIVSGRHVMIENGEIHFGYTHLETPPREELDRQAMMLGYKPQQDGEHAPPEGRGAAPRP